MTLHRSAVSTRVISTIALCASLGAWLPAQAAVVLSAAGSYTLGANSGAPGTVSSTPTGCGSSGQDVLDFTGASSNSIGLHAYACDYSGSISFGSRSSGENTYYVDGTASVTGSITASGGAGLSFFVSGGQVGAFGSTGFVAGEYQQSSLSIFLDIGGTVYLNDLWDTSVGTGGLLGFNESHAGLQSVGSTGPTTGAGFVSYGINSGFIFIDVPDGDYDISYMMRSMARGNVSSTTVCRGTVYEDRGGQEIALDVARLVDVGDNELGGDPGFASYCGAGAQSGDPFPPIARAALVPEPGSIGLVATALVALGGLRRRRHQTVQG